MIDLDAIKARLAAATPGPWMEFAKSGEWWIGRVSDDPELDTAGICDSGNVSEGDVDFITHAPTDIAALIEEVETLRAQRDGWKEEAMRGFDPETAWEDF